MEKVVRLYEYREGSGDPVLSEHLLLDEGLDLLAAFRSVRDPIVRQALVEMVRAAAREQNSDG